MKKSNLILSIAAAAVLLAAAFFVYQNYYPFSRGGYGGYHMGRGMPGHWGMGFLMPLFWILIIGWVVSLLIPRTSGSRPADKALFGEPDAVEILKQRYARGEIDKTEFKSKSADLQST